MLPLRSSRSTYNMACLLREWDKATKEKRKVMLQDFIRQNKNRSGPELEIELAQMASLLLARICVWIKLTYMTGTCLTEQIQVLYIFLSASSSYTFLTEFLEHGGVLCLQELCVLSTSREIDKRWALRVLSCVANAGTKYKETICECYGIRAVAECMAKSKSEETQETARCLLETLAEGNPRFADQVYKGLIGVLPCNSAKAQQLALQTIRILQATRQTANRALIDRIICILESLHLEVQSAAIELIRDLMKFSIADDILLALVALLRPQQEIQLGRLFAESASNPASSDDFISDSDSEVSHVRSSVSTHLSSEGGIKSTAHLSISLPEGATDAVVNSWTTGRQSTLHSPESLVQTDSEDAIASAAPCTTPSSVTALQSSATTSKVNIVHAESTGGDPNLKRSVHKSSSGAAHQRRSRQRRTMRTGLSKEGSSDRNKQADAAGAAEEKSTKRHRFRNNEGAETKPLAVFVQQASAAKCLRIVSQDGPELSKKVLKLGALSSLLYTMGNLEFPDSQRQASLALEFLCKTYPKVNQITQEALGSMYDEFITNPDSHYLKMTPLQADVLVSNKIAYAGEDLD